MNLATSRNRRCGWRGLVAAVGLLCLAGCGSDEMTAPEPEEDPSDPDGTGIAVNVTSADAFLNSFAASMNGRNYPAYDALLAADFEFHLRDDDAGQFPWAPNDFWGRSEELSLMANMFDGGFSGSEPAVQEIQFTSEALSSQTLDETTTEHTIDALINVITGPNNGFRADTRFVVRLAQDDGGFLRMQRMSEMPKLEPGKSESSRVEDSSWGSVKSLYR